MTRTFLRHLATTARHVPRPLLLAVAAVVVAVNFAIPTQAPSATEPVTPAALDPWFDDAVRDAGIPGAAIAVVQDGRIVHEHGVGTADDTGRPVTGRTPFVIGSLAKSLTALAVGQLAERGRVDLDSPVQGYLPEFAVADPGASHAITVRQLLNQTSGIPGAAGTAPLSLPATSLDSQVRALDLDEYVFEGLRAGASGFLLKNAPAADLVAAVRTVAAGDALLAPAVTRRVIEAFGRRRAPAEAARALILLSAREREVLLLVARGRSNAEIAATLYLGEATVKTHLSSLFAKLGLRDRIEAVIYAYESGLVEPGEP